MSSIIKIVLFFALMMSASVASAQNTIPKIIFDSDIGPDYDDVGALAMLHALADKGECEILATVASNDYPNIVPVLSVINTYFSRPALPIGMVRGKAVQLPAWQKWDSVIVNKYPHGLNANNEADDATRLYRKILAQQSDATVTIVTVGFLTNMSNLLQSQPDDVSPLNGTDLVRKKVERLVSMAGAFPEGREFNVEKDAYSSHYTFEHWPTELIFTGWEIGANIYSGLPLIQSKKIRQSPVKDVFQISIPKSKEDVNGRKSWDQTAVLIAVRGAATFYNLVPGRIVCYADGRNAWNKNGTGHFYVTEKTPHKEVEKIINELMMHIPSPDRSSKTH